MINGEGYPLIVALVLQYHHQSIQEKSTNVTENVPHLSALQSSAPRLQPHLGSSRTSAPAAPRLQRKLQVGLLIAVAGASFLATPHNAFAQAPAPQTPEELGYTFAYNQTISGHGLTTVYAVYYDSNRELHFFFIAQYPTIPPYDPGDDRPRIAQEADEDGGTFDQEFADHEEASAQEDNNEPFIF